MIPTINQKKILYWTSTGMAALGDQFLFAGAGFILNFLLARWMVPISYGIYVYVQSFLLFFIALHTATITEPLMIFSANEYKNTLASYFKIILQAQIITTVSISGILLLFCWAISFYTDSVVFNTGIGLAVILPGHLLIWFCRRICYATLHFWRATFISLIYLVLLIASICFLRYRNTLNCFHVFTGIPIACIIASIPALFYILTQPSNQIHLTLRGIAYKHWQYSRWTIATAFLIWLSGHLYIILIPSFINTEGVAAMRALTNFALPVLHAIAAFSTILIPALAGLFSQNIHPGKIIMKIAFPISIILIAVTFYAWILIANRHNLLDWVYDGKYVEYSHLIPAIALLLIIGCYIAFAESFLKAAQQPGHLFWTYLSRLAVTLFVGIPLMIIWKLDGVIAGMILGYLAVSAILTQRIFKILAHKRQLLHA